MKRTLQAVFLAIFAAEALVVGQASEVKRVLSEIRTALGGEEKLNAVKSIAVEGQTTRPSPDGSTTAQGFEFAFELPATGAKFMRKEVVANMGGMEISRRSGFNGGDLIDQVDMPPSMGDGGRMVRMGPGGGAGTTPEQQAAQKTQQLTNNRREFARLVLGMLGTSTSAYPVEFAYGGKVDSGDGKADVLIVTSTDGFSGKLYVDGKTHLPLMLAWMDKEPMRVTMNNGSGNVQLGGGGQVRTFSTGGGGGGGQVMTQGAGGQGAPDMARMQEEMAARIKEAEANRKTVEFRLFYADYKNFDGVRLPTRLQRMTDGLPTEELSLEKIKVNSKIDAAKFAAGK